MIASNKMQGLGIGWGGGDTFIDICPDNSTEEPEIVDCNTARRISGAHSSFPDWGGGPETGVA